MTTVVIFLTTVVVVFLTTVVVVFLTTVVGFLTKVAILTMVVVFLTYSGRILSLQGWQRRIGNLITMHFAIKKMSAVISGPTWNFLTGL